MYLENRILEERKRSLEWEGETRNRIRSAEKDIRGLHRKMRVRKTKNQKASSATLCTGRKAAPAAQIQWLSKKEHRADA